MSVIKPNVFKIVQSYGGLKESYFEVESATAADVIDFADNNVEGAKLVVLQDADGAAVSGKICGSDDNTVIVGTGPSAEPLHGTLKFRAY